MTGLYQFLKKYGVGIGFGVGTLLAFLTYLFILIGFPEGQPTKKELYEYNIFDFGIISSQWLVYIAVFLVLVFFIKQAVEDPQGSIKPLAGIGILVVVYFITQGMSDGVLTLDMVRSNSDLIPEGEVFEAGVTTSEDVAFSDGLIKFGYFMLGTAIISWLLGLVYGVVKQ